MTPPALLNFTAAAHTQLHWWPPQKAAIALNTRTFSLTLVRYEDSLFTHLRHLTYPHNSFICLYWQHLSLPVIKLSSIAPCLPDDVVAVLECHTNVMNVSWTQTPGSDDYTAWAMSSEGHRTSCNSTSTSCSIHDLQCGQVYEVAVTSSSIDCKIIAGSDYKVQSGEFSSFMLII